jgi:hypothetical protein
MVFRHVSDAQHRSSPASTVELQSFSSSTEPVPDVIPEAHRGTGKELFSWWLRVAFAAGSPPPSVGEASGCDVIASARMRGATSRWSHAPAGTAARTGWSARRRSWRETALAQQARSSTRPTGRACQDGPRADVAPSIVPQGRSRASAGGQHLLDGEVEGLPPGGAPLMAPRADRRAPSRRPASGAVPAGKIACMPTGRRSRCLLVARAHLGRARGATIPIRRRAHEREGIRLATIVRPPSAAATAGTGSRRRGRGWQTALASAILRVRRRPRPVARGARARARARRSSSRG